MDRSSGSSRVQWIHRREKLIRKAQTVLVGGKFACGGDPDVEAVAAPYLNAVLSQSFREDRLPTLILLAYARCVFLPGSH